MASGDTIPHRLVQQIRNINTESNSQVDFIIWKSSTDGHYSNNDAWKSSSNMISLLKIWRNKYACKYGNQNKFYLTKMENQIHWMINAFATKAIEDRLSIKLANMVDEDEAGGGALPPAGLELELGPAAVGVGAHASG
ncbi:hypothetical protein HAX54_027527 [Datura stramonium]|uniref:Uncharacterized protein n=1 Tax=Datura stramonium TaxID=4076 RepID=A0ABS8V4L3_DATST|nr:hypothetical protein [Datura stramonium]